MEHFSFSFFWGGGGWSEECFEGVFTNLFFEKVFINKLFLVENHFLLWVQNTINKRTAKMTWKNQWWYKVETRNFALKTSSRISLSKIIIKENVFEIYRGCCTHLKRFWRLRKATGRPPHCFGWFKSHWEVGVNKKLQLLIITRD